MPKIYDYFGLIFFLYAGDHNPVHIHVKRGSSENIYDLIFTNGRYKGVVQRRSGKTSLDKKDASTAEKLIDMKYQDILNKFNRIVNMRDTNIETIVYKQKIV